MDKIKEIEEIIAPQTTIRRASKLFKRPPTTGPKNIFKIKRNYFSDLSHLKNNKVVCFPLKKGGRVRTRSGAPIFKKEFKELNFTRK